jgi:hypothetical protein
MNDELKRDCYECDKCCKNFECGDPITVRYPNGDNAIGIFISSECGHFIWRNITAGSVLECSSCELFAIRERIPVAVAE